MRIATPRMDEGTLPAAGGITLFWRRWIPENPRAVVILVHGVNEHSGRYLHAGEAFSAERFATYAYDHRGHGRSGGPRTFVHAWTDYRGDLSLMIEKARQEHPGLPIFAWGHSMGAMIVIDHAMANPEVLRGAILSGVPLDTANVAKPWLILLARLMSRLVPGFAMDLGIPSSGLSRDPEVAKAYDADPLVGHKATARWGTEMLDVVARVKATAEQLKLPVFIVHGEGDQIALATGSRFLHERCGSTDKTLEIYPGALHEVHNDLAKTSFLGDLARWLAARA